MPYTTNISVIIIDYMLKSLMVNIMLDLITWDYIGRE